MKKFKYKASLIWYLLLFISVTAIVTIALFVYGALERRYGDNISLIAGVMFCIIVALAVFITTIDFLCRRYIIGKRVDEILEATDKIASGDFSSRLEITHSFAHYNQFDYIKENLNKMSEELARTEMVHTDFISNISHEIKTPLAVIQNYAMLLNKPDLDEDSRIKYAGTLLEAAKRITVLAGDILKLNKLENQQLNIDNESINLSEMLTETILSFEDAIERKNITLECNLDEDVKIVCVASYLEIVWNNLLSNAVKFTESGGKITVTLKRCEGEIIVSVADTGCGISKETGKHIFEKFYQGDTSHSKEGNGLGLALVKKVIDRIGGEISVESEIGKGSTFTIKLREGENVG